MIDLSRDWPYILRVAELRLAHNQTERHVSLYGNSIEIRGAAGEFAARRFFGLPEKLHTEFDGGVDLRLDEKSVDVKATKLVDYIDKLHLQWPYGKPFIAEIIILTAVDIEGMRAEMIGWATKDEMEAAPVNPDRRDPCHEIKVTKLRPIQELQHERESSQENPPASRL